MDEISRAESEWVWSEGHQQFCQVIETQTIWGEAICRVWLPDAGSVVCIPVSRLKPLDSVGPLSLDAIAYAAAAARVADALTQDMLLAPIESRVIPLPHQIRVLSRAIAGRRVRFLLADEVGLGKTIEAGLIMRELKLRGLVRRTLVVAPKGLVGQWVEEMRTHFNESLYAILPEDIKTLGRISVLPGAKSRTMSGGDPEPMIRNPWTLFPQVVAPMDSVKPVDRRAGWSAAQIGEHNRERFEDLVSAGWDLIIVDEAHRLGGSTDQVARFKLGQGLSQAAPYFLMLSATPHQGKTDAFHRLMSLIDDKEFADAESATCERIQRYVIRTEKRSAISASGEPLFKPRWTQLAPVRWEERHRGQQLLYDAITEYVREGYNQAMREKRTYVGFLMVLMQRLVVSSTRAIRTTLERRLEALTAPGEQLTLFPAILDEEWVDLDGQEQIDALLRSRLKALKNERAEVKLLMEAAARCEQSGPDAKAEALLEWIYRLQAEEGDSELKVLVFTEFVPTQEMLSDFLADRGFPVVCINGSMDMEQRRRAQKAFAKDARILISTDAGGEGLNLQFCHVVINYDIPWNPMRLEQRIGRVDRIGQDRTVRAVNFVFEGSVEHRVREVLEEKLAIIRDEFGIDKTADVLDSAQAGRIFDDMYVEAILNPDKVEDSVENVVLVLRDRAREARAAASALGAVEALDPAEAQRLLTHPLPHWVERMTVSYLKAHGGRAEKNGPSWIIAWPDGEVYENVVFAGTETKGLVNARHLTLDEPRVRELALRMPRFAPGQPIAVISIPGLGEEIQGLWSLWQISIRSDGSRVGGFAHKPGARIMSLFLADDGRVFVTTARHIWDRLLMDTPHVCSVLDEYESRSAFSRLAEAAEQCGGPIYKALVQDHRDRIAREREKASYAFAARRRMIERVGLLQVRAHRLNVLVREEREFQELLRREENVYPDMTPILVVRVARGANEQLA